LRHSSAEASCSAFSTALSANSERDTAPNHVSSQVPPSTYTNLLRTLAEPPPQISNTAHVENTPSPNARIGNVLNAGYIIQRTQAQQTRDRNRKRLVDSLEQESLPSYSVKRSKTKGILQHRALDWRTHAGKLAFDRHYASLLSEWGLRGTHEGTCLWLPADWAALDPVSLVEMFIAENCPITYNADGIVYLPLHFEI
jgi:hypothetical protein